MDTSIKFMEVLEADAEEHCMLDHKVVQGFSQGVNAADVILMEDHHTHAMKA